MNKNNIILTVLLLTLSSCATYKVQYKNKEESVNKLPEKEIDRTFFLIGDAGKSPIGGMSLGLQAFNKHILNKDTNKDYAI
ncbi:MAG: hypothetical protein ACPG41_00975, partial [Lacinutrix venerupis]